MQEAFRLAAEEKPASPIVRVIKDVNRTQAAERIRQRKEEQFAQLKEQYESLGGMWHATAINPFAVTYNKYNRIPIEEKRKLWVKAVTSLKDRPPEQRIELLKSLASGMQLTGDHAPPVYLRSILRIESDNPLDFLRDELLGISFSFPSILFMDAISHMVDHSKEQNQEFKDFMTKRSGLKGKIDLPQLFPAISQWVDHSK